MTVYGYDSKSKPVSPYCRKEGTKQTVIQQDRGYNIH